MRVPLGDRPFLILVLTLSGYYMLQVQLMLLLPVLVTHVSGTTQAVAWMYGMDALLAVLLLYPMARLSERYLSEPSRLLLGIGVMTLSLAAMILVSGVAGVFGVLALFYVGGLIAEPAREAIVARYATVRARASYIGLSRIGLALGGLLGYVAGGYLQDAGKRLALPGLPWMVLCAVGCLTLTALAYQFSRVLPATTERVLDCARTTGQLAQDAAP
jgi:DHA1 family multidrug resistance protein-like MFS transporter